MCRDSGFWASITEATSPDNYPPRRVIGLGVEVWGAFAVWGGGGVEDLEVLGLWV